jgi:hypothetical protein
VQLVGKRERLLFRKAELVGFLVVSNVATCGLRTQPFADVGSSVLVFAASSAEVIVSAASAL